MSQDSFSKLSIAELIERARAKEPGALKELFRRCQEQLDKWAERRASEQRDGRLRPSDISQQGAMQAFEHFSTFHGTTEGEWFAWLRVVVLSQAEQLLRKSLAEKSSPADAVSLDEGEALEVFAPQRSPSQFASQSEQERQLAAQLSRLPESQGKALFLFHLEELPVREVAKQLGKSEDAVASLLQRGLATLRDRMAGKADSVGEVTAAVADAYRDFLRRREASESVDIEAFVREYPDCADELRSLLLWVERLAALRLSKRSS